MRFQKYPDTCERGLSFMGPTSFACKSLSRRNLAENFPFYIYFCRFQSYLLLLTESLPKNDPCFESWPEKPYPYGHMYVS